MICLKKLKRLFDTFIANIAYGPTYAKYNTDSEKVEDVLIFDDHKLAVSRHRYVLPKTLLIGCSDETKEIVAA